MFAIIDKVGSITFSEIEVYGETVVPVPEYLEPTARETPARIVWLGDRLADASGVGIWFVSANGTKRAYQVEPDWQQVSGPWNGLLVKEGDVWTIQTREALTRLKLHDAASRLRRQRERAGIIVDSFNVPTDEETRTFLVGAYAAAINDDSFEIPAWKVGNGDYVSLSREQIIDIGQAVLAHVQECFSLNKEADERIIGGQITSEAQLEVLFS